MTPESPIVPVAKRGADPTDFLADLSRRGMLTAALSAAVLGTFAASAAAPAWATGTAPSSPAQMVALAKSQVGKTLAQLQTDPMTESPYSTYRGAWCAVFATWLTRGAGVPYKTYAVDAYNSCTHVDSPAAGDLIYYSVGHVGVVIGVSGNNVATVEGNTPGQSWVSNYVKQYVNAWSPNHVFSRPNWPSNAPADPGSAPSPAQKEDTAMLRIISYSAGGSNPRNGIILAGPGFWHGLSSAEWSHWGGQGLFADIPVVTPANDYAWDMLRDIMLKTTPTFQ